MEGRQWISREHVFWVILLTGMLIPLYQQMNTDSSSDCNLMAEERIEKGSSSIAVGEYVESDKSESRIRKAINFLRDPSTMVSDGL